MGELHLFFSQPNLSSLRVSFFSASRSTGGCLLWLQLYIYIHTQGQLVVAYFDCRYMFTPNMQGGCYYSDIQRDEASAGAATVKEAFKQSTHRIQTRPVSTHI
ncbi:hypothetical protein BS78_K127900 [Paspalum vaginatum]|uniref:Uncharacterized protein n=1 Tax=Paspalum vaginatum TaxID=158149 RepID=A0A9W8CFM0_9POAL|nr:hypothetical protein BS78_K127900 [Paspalum vaginatum]